MLSSLAALLAFTWQPSHVFTSFLTAGPFASGGRTPCQTDPIAYQIVTNTWSAPKSGSHVSHSQPERQWKTATAGNDGWVSDEALSGGYAYVTYDSTKNEVLTLDASGHSMVYVNGVPRGGDPYGFGYVQLPVDVKKGRNEFLFSVGRGRLRAALKPCDPIVNISQLDPTFPDLIVGETSVEPASVLLSNPTAFTYRGKIRSVIEGKAGEWSVARVTPMTVRKVAFDLPQVATSREDRLTVTVELDNGQKRNFEVDVKPSSQAHKRTFRFSVDDSVQYYAVQPASQPGARALVLSLHGASVEASSQAASYGQKPWCNIVCPTNGRPYGFDWEDWGRQNAMEALEDARRRYRPESDRIYLTGHSMGGHGTWSVGFNHPNQFAAIAPCAGWISFWSYVGAAEWKNPDPVETLLRRAMNASDTLELLTNSTNFGVFVQHGDADDNVPVEQAREMRRRLASFHRDVDWHEEPGQGHWYDTDKEAGANVQDYAPLFDFLAKHRLPSVDEKRIWDLTVLAPDGSRRAGNVEILSRLKAMVPARIQVRTFADGTYEELKTTNALALALHPMTGSKSIKVDLDGQVLDIKFESENEPVTLVQSQGQWRIGPVDRLRLIEHEGGIKSCFQKSVLVYGTKGNKAANSWSYNKARYDAETWWYRSSGSFELRDDSVIPEISDSSERLVCYGNPQTNAVLGKLWAESDRKDMEWSEKRVTFGDAGVSGDLGALIMFKSRRRVVGMIGGSTLMGCRSIERAPLFLSGAHFPDIFVATPDMLLKGSKGVSAAGFYGADWAIDTESFARR
ncbi:MAG: prolyl oligopeptidase family serine peptidase [Chthonomonadaceae bacterium]|nr:prolyl oligopeptidase family serine peptidase [Chthonomonadaceae bacterium]